MFSFYLPQVLRIESAKAMRQFDTSIVDTSGIGSLTIVDAVGNVVSVLQVTITPVCSALFILGAFLYTVSGEKEDRKSLGKDFMIGSIIGLAVVLGARAILELTMLFIYG